MTFFHINGISYKMFSKYYFEKYAQLTLSSMDNFVGRFNLSDKPDLQDIKKYIVEDVLIPTIKKTITDVVKNSIDMFFYGEVSRSTRSNSSRISYSSYYDRDREPRSRRNSLLIDDIVLESRAEAEEVLDRLDEMIEEFGMASVLNLYDLIGVTAPFTADKYGWTDIRNATAVRVRDGYLLKLPRVMPLD